MRDEDGYTNPFPDMGTPFDGKHDMQLLYTLHFINAAIKEGMSNINDEKEFRNHPYFPLFLKAAETPIHRLTAIWLETEEKHGRQEGEGLTPRNLTFAFGYYYRSLGFGFFGEVHHYALIPVAQEAIEAWTEEQGSTAPPVP